MNELQQQIKEDLTILKEELKNHQEAINKILNHDLLIEDEGKSNRATFRKIKGLFKEFKNDMELLENLYILLKFELVFNKEDIKA